MSYPGNSSLAAEIQERILATFEQTLDLASKGELSEAAIGCDFILRLDPTFEPASQLKRRLDQGGTQNVDDLRGSAGPPPGSAKAPAETPAEHVPEEFPTAPVDVFELAGRDAMPPGAKDGEPAFTDVQAEELEAALDWSALTDTTPEATSEPATATSDDTGSETQAAPIDEDEVPMQEPAEPVTPALEEQPSETPGLMSSSEPLAALDSESEQRIQELLGEGQASFDDGRYQSAIDAWSRIFLVDIDHQEASRRIEMARKLKAEVERQVEELYHEGVSQVETGDFDAARASFSKVIEMQGSHLAAQEYLDKLETGTIAAREEPPPAPEPPQAPAAAPAETLSIPDDLAEPIDELAALPGEALEMPGELGELADIPEPPTERPARARRPRPAPKGAKPPGVKRSFLYIGGGVLLLAAAAAWFLFRNFDDTFPNAGQTAPPISRPQVDVIARAQGVHDEGNAELAIAQLKRLPPNHPRYAEAQALIAQWETPETDPGAQPQASPEHLAERDALVTEARAAFENRGFLRAHRLLTQAAAVTALGDEGLQLQTAAALELQPLRSEIEIFKQGEWAQALRSLWQMRQSDPGNPDVEQLMVDSYYNLGVRELQRRDPAAAARNLQEALDIAGEDPELERLLGFAESYQNRSVDLLYRIFVKYLPFR